MDYSSAIKRKQVLMHVTTLINFNKIILSKRSEAQESRATWFHLYEILGKTSKLEM